jgi:hypothetical protein
MKKSAVFRVSDSFTLRKIDSKEMTVKFFKGEYANRKLPEARIKSSGTLLKISKDVGKDINSETYRFKDKNNNNQTIYTTNHVMYDYHANECNELPIIKCKYCKRTILKNPMGLPISMEISNDDISFTAIDSFCDFGCTFSYLKRKTGQSRIYTGPLYCNAEQILHCLYYRVYPDRFGKNIKDKADWELLKENGGSLTNEEFDNEAAGYFCVPSVTVAPVKKQYLKFTNNN